MQAIVASQIFVRSQRVVARLLTSAKFAVVAAISDIPASA